MVWGQLSPDSATEGVKTALNFGWMVSSFALAASKRSCHYRNHCDPCCCYHSSMSSLVAVAVVDIVAIKLCMAIHDFVAIAGILKAHRREHDYSWWWDCDKQPILPYHGKKRATCL